MSGWKFIGRILSIVAGCCLYILIWLVVYETWDEYAAELYDGWCWEKVLGIFYRIWVWGHIIAVIGGIIAWFIWSWM